MQTNHRIGLLAMALSLIFASLALSVSADKAPGTSYLDSNKILPVSQLKRGMKGYALTVFQGTKIEKFGVEILGVLKNANEGKDYILARIWGDVISARGLGVAQGMSGSPVYINGKLVGAISAAMSWSKEPIGMITPITDMVEALDDHLPKRASGYSTPDTLSEPAVVNGKSYTKVVVDGPNAKKTDDDALHVTPLAMPVMVSGLSGPLVDDLKKILAPYNVTVMAGGGAGGKSVENVDAQLVPGAAVAVSLATGDIDMTATGTVTYRNGNKLVAFGHPFLGVGAIDAPMSTAYIVDVLASYQIPTKLAVPIKMVGRMFQDRPWSIAGSVGSFAQMVPVRIAVDDQTTKRSKVFNIKVINHPQLGPQLATMMVKSAIAQMHGTPGDATAEVSYQVKADRIGTIKRSNVFFDQASIDSASTSDVGMLMRILSGNEFQPLDIQSVDVKVLITDKRKTATIDRIFVKKSEYAPGDTVDVGVVMRPYKQERITKTFSIKIPATTPNGKVVLQVKGGGTPEGISLGMAGAGEDGSMMVVGNPGVASADNVKQLVDKYLERERNNQIVVQLLLPSTAINIAGEKLTGLPSSIADVMKSSRNSGLRMEREEVKKVYDDDTIVSGSARLQIDIKQNSLDENRPGPAGSQPSPAPMAAMSADGMDGFGTSVSTDPDDGNGVMNGMIATGSGPSVSVTEKPAAAPATTPQPATAPAQTAPKPEEKKPAEPAPAPATDVKTVVRQTQSWSQRTQADFAKGKFAGVATSSENKLVLTPTLAKLAETPEQFVWCVAAAGNGVYAGTGNSGKIFHVSDNGELKLFSDTGELEVHSLALDSKGNLYAGTSPNGKVFKITPDGKSSVVLDAEEKYILALAVDGSDNVYAGAGDAGKIYRITPDGKAGVFANVSAQEILSLHWDKQGHLLAGTGIDGVVYEINDKGAAQPVFDAAETSISSVTSDSQGNIYAGTATPKGVVYKITPDGKAKNVFNATARVLSMVADPADNVYAISDGTLVKIAPDEVVTQLDSSKDGPQYLSLALNARTGVLYAGTGNIGSIYASKRAGINGTFESAVHDTKMTSKWGRIKWTAELPQGTGVELQTRSGNVDTPDETWSAWSKAYTNGSGEQIADSNARYIQYRVTLKTTRPDVSPMVSGVTISYLTPNQQPVVKITEPSGGAVLSGTKPIKWSGMDPDKDKLTYDVYYSKDGKQWTALVGGATKEEKKLSTQDIAGKIKGELDKSTDVPQDMKDGILKDQDPAAAAAAATASRAGQSSASTTYDWDTKKVDDGTYYIKVVVSDKSSNASGALTNKAISDPIVVCNTPPTVRLLVPNTMKLDAAGPAVVSGSAESKMVEISGVQYRIDGGDWVAAAPEDGVFDSPQESFSLTTDSLSTGSHKLEVQAVDAAGNAATEKTEVKVP